MIMAPSSNETYWIAMTSNTLERLLNVIHSPLDDNESMKLEVPAIAAGINFNTYLGSLSLHGEDAEAVFALVTEIALRRAGQGGIGGVKIAAAPSELAQLEAIYEHVYPEPIYGTRVPLESGDLRADKELQRKGLVLVLPGIGPNCDLLMAFTPLGAEVYAREAKRLEASAEEHA